jgi:hypothetical protein
MTSPISTRILRIEKQHYFVIYLFWILSEGLFTKLLSLHEMTEVQV